MNRRDLLRLGAVGVVTFAAGGVKPLGGARAGAQMSAPPTVDRLVLTNVVDNVYDAFARGGKLDAIAVQRYALDPRNPIQSQHGLAYHLESVRAAERREILLDFAFTESALFTNYGLLKIDPAQADALIVSHGHFDHYGALPDLARVTHGKRKGGVTLYAGGDDTFCHRVVVTPAGTVDYGTLDRAALEARGLGVAIAKQPTVVAGHAVVTGQIARTTDFETPPAAARLVAGPLDSACAAGHFGTTTVEVRPGDLVPDTFQGEHATVYLVKDRGLVVITSCGHAGVVNSVRQAQKVTGIQKVHAIVGGFHLAPAPDAIVAKTVVAFKEINPDYVIPMHCSGLNFIMALHMTMPKTLVMPSTGTRVVFGV
jgi:7,8-dihydropterin-6-yl-methyl-4-(beta-D-ribofuranosyl)aminobenzene 5'-phosphate synthase